MNYIIIGIFAVIIIIILYIFNYVYRTYNYLINLRMNADRQASHLQAHLKKKFDMIPALIEIVKGYTKHEKSTLEEVIRLRSQWGAAKNITVKTKTGNMLESALSKLMVVHERYPDLKADRSFMNIQNGIWHVEKELLNERKVYNKRVSFYNVKLQEFPSNIIAKMFGFEEKPFFSMEEEPSE